MVVQIRSHQRRPVSLRVPCVIRRSITTKRIACSARLFVGSMPGVVMKRKYASPCFGQPARERVCANPQQLTIIVDNTAGKDVAIFSLDNFVAKQIGDELGGYKQGL